MNFEQAKERAEQARLRAKALGDQLRMFPRNEMGLVPDSIKFSEPYRGLKTQFDAAFAKERQTNAYLIKHFKAELQRERGQRRGRSDTPYLDAATTTTQGESMHQREQTPSTFGSSALPRAQTQLNHQGISLNQAVSAAELAFKAAKNSWLECAEAGEAPRLHIAVWQQESPLFRAGRMSSNA